MHDASRSRRSLGLGSVARGGAAALAFAVALAAAQAARAQDAPAPAPASAPTPAPPGAAGEAAAPDDFFCPDCRLPLRWDQDVCPQCGAAFEPLRPRTKRGEAPAYEPAGAPPPASPGGEPAGPGREDESPFEGDPAGRPRSPEERVDVTRYGAGDRLLDQPWPQIAPPERSRFALGSYGRVGIPFNERLKGADGVDLVDFVPRLTKGSYQELHFYYRDTLAELPVLVKTTVAFQEDLFHENGRFDAQIALREAYAEVEPSDDLALWMGARMYRGNDVYLLDFWPLDDQNTVGLGAAFRLPAQQRLQVHAGFNRIVDESFFQFQTIELPQEDGVGVREAVFLDRYRVTTSATWQIDLVDLLEGVQVKAHTELSYLPGGRRRVAGDLEERLPSDHGFLLGGQVGYSFGPQSFVRFFVTYAQGLSAYDELAVPFGFDDEFSVSDSSMLRLALAGSFDSEYVGVHFGAYWQRFEDSDGQSDRDDATQAAIAVRPLVYLGDYVQAGFEASFQALRTRAIFAETGSEEDAYVTKLQLLLGLAAGKGPYARPALYVFYGHNWLNEGARLELERRLADRPSARSHVFGFQAEWWF